MGTRKTPKKPPDPDEALRRYEERFEGLVELSTDWYWEQDENLRFTLITGSAVKSGGIDAKSFLGTFRWDRGAVPVGDGGSWDRHKAVLQAKQPFTDFLYKRIDLPGELRYLSASGRPVFDDKGRFRGYRGIAKDVTKERRAELLLRLEHTVTRSLAEAASASAALKAVTRAICETENWECGRYFRLDEKAGVLRFAEAWGMPGEAIERFIARSHDMTYAPGAGLAGRAWQTEQPVWAADITQDGRVAQVVLARETGMHGAFVFPVMSEAKVIGVFAFNSRQVRDPDERLLEAIRVIGNQIGQFVQRKQAEDVVRESEERFRSLIELSSDAYWEQDEQFRFIRFTDLPKGSFRVPDQERNTFIGKTRWELPNSRTSTAEWEAHKATLDAHKPFYDFVHSRDATDGKLHYISVSGLPIFDEDGNFKGYRGVTRDITERKAAEERIRHLAQHDELTGLPNRTMFNQNVKHAINRAQRYDRTLAILFIDLDRFKLINDTLGHEAGDRALEEIGERLQGCMRGSDTIARFGGDEFVILIEEFTTSSDIAGVVSKLLGAVKKPWKHQTQELSLSASIGISTYPEDGKDAQTLLKNADIAMYRAKDKGRNTFQFYSSEMNVHSVERLALESSLRMALERGEFLLHYQPKVEINTGRIVGMEALIRWRHPELGLIFPDQFIPLAEETGLIVPIGEWVLKTACSQNRAWQQQGMRPLRIAVNLSARQFMHEQLVEDVAEVLKQTGLDAEFLELELTESTVMQNPEKTIKILNAFKAMGIHLAIDDFGTGYSSLAYIKQFPIDSLKVDQSFIKDIPSDGNDVAITKAIIALAQNLKLTVVAEGVENAEQLSFLRDHICDQMQGYYCSKPLSEHDFVNFLRTST